MKLRVTTIIETAFLATFLYLLIFKTNDVNKWIAITIITITITILNRKYDLIDKIRTGMNNHEKE